MRVRHLHDMANLAKTYAMRVPGCEAKSIIHAWKASGFISDEDLIPSDADKLLSMIESLEKRVARLEKINGN